MGALHLVNRSPGESPALSQCLQRVANGDAVLLLESGVYAGLKESAFAARLAASMGQTRIHALEPDMATRGIAGEEMMDGIVLVDYAGFVGLSVLHNPIITWN